MWMQTDIDIDMEATATITNGEWVGVEATATTTNGEYRVSGWGSRVGWRQRLQPPMGSIG